MFKLGVIAIVAVGVIAAGAAAAPGQIAGDEYAVWVDKLNFRIAPAADAKVLEVLERGARVRDRGSETRTADDQEWREVTAADGKAGWVADHYIIPAAVYDDFARADALGRAGNAAKMAEEIAAVNQQRGNDGRVITSPDGRQVIVEVAGMGQAWVYEHLYGPVLHFTAGQGLANYLGPSGWAEGIWSPDSRWVVAGGGPNYSGGFSAYDAANYNFTELGAVMNGGYEFFGGYLIWYRLEVVSEPRPAALRGFMIPSLVATDLALGKTMMLLQPDGASARRLENRNYYEVKLIPVPDVPAPLEDAPLFQEYNNKFVPVYEPEA
jgi:SH3-like domain-containing protein